MNRLTKPERSALMASVRSKGTKPERLVRSWLHRNGFRFRLHRRGLPGTPDIVLSKHRTVVLVHGCFWHGHSCAKGKTMPTSNFRFWVSKIQGNRARDKCVRSALRAAGWHVEVVWECEISSVKAMSSRLERLCRTLRRT